MRDVVNDQSEKFVTHLPCTRDVFETAFYYRPLSKSNRKYIVLHKLFGKQPEKIESTRTASNIERTVVADLQFS